MGLFSVNNEEKSPPPPLGGGPLGLGDPDDRRLRKTEKDILIPKMLREEATKRCTVTLNEMLQCAKKSGLLEAFKCQEEKQKHTDCLTEWVRNPEFVEEVTEKYLYARSYYRRTGKPLEPYVRIKRKLLNTEAS